MNALSGGLTFLIGLGILLGPVLDAAYKQIGWVAIVYPLLIFFMLGFTVSDRSN